MGPKSDNQVGSSGVKCPLQNCILGVEQESFRFYDATCRMLHRIGRYLFPTRYRGTGHEVGLRMELVQQSRRDLIIEYLLGLGIGGPAVGHDNVCIDKFVDVDTRAKAKCGSGRLPIVPLVGIDLYDVDRQNRRGLDP